MSNRHVYIDYETYSSVDLKKHGLRRYAASPDFKILLCSIGWYEEDKKVVKCYDLTVDGMPDELKKLLLDTSIIKHAWNAQFERVCTEAVFGCKLPIKAWQCSMVHAMYCGLPGSLDECGRILGIEETKLFAEGKKLIRKFCSPRAPTKTDPRTEIGNESPDWEDFKVYNIQDVKAEMAIEERIRCFPLPERELQLYMLDQKINDLGIMIDSDFVVKADRIHEAYTRTCRYELMDLLNTKESDVSAIGVKCIKKVLKSYGVDLPTKINASGATIDTLEKAGVEKLLSIKTLPEPVIKILMLYRQLHKTSNAKYRAMLDTVSAGGRIRGLFQHYGANRTGRWAGRLVQLHNLPQNHIDSLAFARDLVIKYAEDYAPLELLFGDVSSTLSQLIRTAFVAKEGTIFAVVDFSAIEARVTAWLAGEKWRLDVFNTHGKIYEASAAKMFGIPIENITKGSEFRKKGKIAELAFGFGGGVGAAKNFGADAMGYSDAELQSMVNDWRNSSPNIVQFWRDCYLAAITAVNEKTGKEVPTPAGLKFRYETNTFNNTWLTVELHSGRKLFYFSPHKVPGKFTNESLAYISGDNTNKYVSTQTYGGKLAENIIQATARDLLAEKMLELDAIGFSICLHVHDEVVCEIDMQSQDTGFGKMMDIMKSDVYWAPGLPIDADGYMTPYYKKD